MRRWSDGWKLIRNIEITSVEEIVGWGWSRFRSRWKQTKTYSWIQIWWPTDHSKDLEGAGRWRWLWAGHRQFWSSWDTQFEEKVSGKVSVFSGTNWVPFRLMPR